MNEALEVRKTEYQVSDIFPQRWSPRAMSGESISDEELMSLFEAARWAPSSRNNQPWRFIFAKRDSPEWDNLFNLLVEKNQQWCKRAAVLIVVISKNIFDYQSLPNLTHSFDTGSAWQSLALQGSLNNLVVHGMAGFDYEKSKKELNIPDEYTVEMMFAVGKHGKKEDLPEELQKVEVPSSRIEVKELIFEGKFVK